MVVSEKQLQALINGHIVGEIGDVAAFKNGSKNLVKSFLHPADLEPAPMGRWVDAIRAKLEQRGFILPSQKFFRQPLPLKTRVNTILGDPPYTVFDAFFYWED
jgi:hypothetical protein